MFLNSACELDCLLVAYGKCLPIDLYPNLISTCALW